MEVSFLDICSTIVLQPYIVENVSFPGDILVGHDSMASEKVDLLPSKKGIEIDRQFLASDGSKGNHSPELENRIREVSTGEEMVDSDVNNYMSLDVLMSCIDRRPVVVAAGGLRLQPQEVKIVQVRVVDTPCDVEVISLPETVPIKGLTIDHGLFQTKKEGMFSLPVYNVGPTHRDLNEDSIVCMCDILPAKVQEVADVKSQESVVGSVRSRSRVDLIPYVEVNPEVREEGVKKFFHVLEEYADVLALPGDRLGHTSLIKHKIPLQEGAKPCYVPAYRIPHKQRDKVDELIGEMLDNRVIEESCSPWNSPMFLVPKKGGELRPVVDYRRINEMTIKDRYPIPNLHDLLTSLGGGYAYFSTLDLLSGYWQVELDEEDRPVSAFSTPSGHYQYRRMPMGLCNSGATFQRLVNSLFRGLIGKTMFAYLDDLIIVSTNLEEHLQRLTEVLQKLREAGLKVKLKKCKFLMNKIEFLGHDVTSEGLHTNCSKVEAINQFPRPTNVDNVRSFLGLSGYYRIFIQNYAQIALPLSTLLKKDVKFEWGEEQEKAFQELKKRLTQAPVLIYPDFKKEFILHTDASLQGVGAVLMQRTDKGRERVVAYASRTLKPSEKNYAITHLEGLAVIFALKKFHYLILGYKISIFTDHAPLRTLFQSKDLSGRLARWAGIIQEYHPTIHYLPGKANKVADALSRQPLPVCAVDGENQTDHVPQQEDCPGKRLESITSRDIITAQKRDPLWSQVIHALDCNNEVLMPKMPFKYIDFVMNEDGVLCRDTVLSGSHLPQREVRQIVIPSELVSKILYQTHNTVHAGHPGARRMLRNVKRSYLWLNMDRDIKKYVKECQSCATYKGAPNVKGIMHTYPVPLSPWETVGIDILKLPLSMNGFIHLTVLVGHFSRDCIFVPSKDKSAKSVANALLNNLICPFTTPRALLSDNGTEFNNAIIEELCQNFKIKKCNINVYHPSSNGLVERANRKVLEIIRHLVGSDSDAWDEWIPQVASSINCSVNESIKESPHFVIFGSEKRVPYDLLNSNPSPVYNPEDYTNMRVRDFQVIHQRVREALKETNTEMALKVNKRKKKEKEIKKDDVVYILNQNRKNKLDVKFHGPARVLECSEQGRIKVIYDSGVTEEVHRDHIKRVERLPLDNVKIPQSQTVKSKNKDNAVNIQSLEYKKKLRSAAKSSNIGSVMIDGGSKLNELYALINYNFYT